MTTEPTAKHQQEAREPEAQGIVSYCESPTVPFQQKMGYVLDALSSRDTEIKEALEGLRGKSGCWCDNFYGHSPACLATRVLWNKVQG